MSCPLHSNDNSCAGCAKVKIQRLERQLAEKEEISNKWQDRWRGEVSRNSELTKLIEDLEDRLAEARQNIYKFAEIALMEGKDEFGHSWEDFKLYVLDEQLKEKGDD